MKRSGPIRRTGFARREVGRRGRADGVDVIPPDPPAAPAPPKRRDRVPATMTPVARAIRPVPKQPHELNARVLRLANGRPCLFRWRHGCLRDDTSTTVACHENRLAAQKGLGYKAHDWRSAWGCSVCHAAFDQPRDGTPAEVLDAVFAAAWGRQLAEWTAITHNPSEKPWARAAAAWALERAAAHGALPP